MIKNYLKIALRNVKNQKGYSLLNFIGLAIGLSVTLVITLYVLDDLTFDRFHENKDRIYRILSIGVKRGTKNSITVGPLVREAMETIPEVLSATRITRGGRMLIGPVGTDFNSPEGQDAMRLEAIRADSHFFDVFSFKIVQGAQGDALKRKESIFLTPEAAQALFGDNDPVGQSVAVRGIENATVVGIVEAPPANSHIRFEMIAPLIPEQFPQFWDSWETLALMGYVLLDENADPVLVAGKMKDIAYSNNFPEIFEPRLQALADIHLGSSDHSYDNLNAGRSDKVVFYTMGFIGILVLLVACINFINLTTSRASQRAREVGLRKVVGSRKIQLVGQFLGESVLFTMFSFMASLFIVELALPYLNTVMNKSLDVSFSRNIALILIFFLISSVIGLISGLYPALVISSFQPVSVIQGELTTGNRGAFLRRALVVFQFTITTVLIISVSVVISQIGHLKSIDLGYNRSQVLAISSSIDGEDDLLKNRLLTLTDVVGAGRIDALPGPNFWRFELIREGVDRSENFTASRFLIDEDTFSTLEIKMKEGRNFSSEFPSDAEEAIIVNETLVNKFGYENPIGLTLRYYDENNNNSITSRRIIGVIKDFHYMTVRQKSEPMIFMLNPHQSPLLLVRIPPGQTSQTLAGIKDEYERLYPDRPFRYFFMDDTFNEQFERDREFMRNIGIFAGLAIFIACLGLIGLVAFTIEQRRKEIAIRKILGCGEGKVYTYLATDFIKWVFLANFLAWPAGYWATKTWLANFVFRVPFQPLTFGLGSLITLVLALMTISFQTMKAARSSPADSLRQVG